MNRNILFTSVGVAELVDIKRPVCADDKVIVKTVVSTISSGTERANLNGDPTVSILSKPTDPVVFPRQAGYSSAGEIVEVGKDVSGFKVGDRVAMSWSCHREYNHMATNLIYKLDDGITYEDAALFHIGTFPLAAIRKCRLEIGESAIVMGQGVLGQLAIKQLRCAGAVPIIAVDPIKEKRDRALALGADYALDPTEESFAEKVKEIVPGGVKVAIEVTGFGKALDGVLDCMAPFGRVALLGCTRSSDFSIDYYRKVHGPGITLIGAHTMARPRFESSEGYWTQKDDVTAEIKLHSSGRLCYGSLVEETHSPAECKDVYHRLSTEKSFPLVQFDWRKL